ncbi:MAG: acetyl-CoA hydrolase/transferase C-terminal domain-containing protein [Oscillospiraceae bacterium]
MENWKKYYDEHMMTQEGAVELIESGDTLYVGNTCGVPHAVLDKLADRYEELHDVTLISNMFCEPLKMLADKKYRSAFRHISYFPAAQERKAHSLGLLEYGSVPYGYVSDSACNVYKTNVIMVETCEPDENGMVNLGEFGSWMASDFINGKYINKVIAVVNKYQTAPAGGGKNIMFPVTKFNAFCRNDHPYVSLRESDPEEIDKTIANYIMDYVHDGDTIQVGKGGLGCAIGYDLAGKKDIHIYSEILSDWIVPLAEKGIITDTVASGCFGTQPLYDYADTCETVSFICINELANPDAVAKLNDFVAINTCMMADLTGQSCSEGSGAWQYSCVGGQLEFVKGANRIRNSGRRGMGFLALRSTRTDKDGTVKSNIVAEFPPMSVVTCPRAEAMYFVTEFGVADLWGKTVTDRVRAMIAIAHPDFREELKQKSISSGLMHPEDFE